MPEKKTVPNLASAMASPKIALFVNSMVGNRGNIGYRAHRVVDEGGLDPRCAHFISRGVVQRVEGARYFGFGPLGHLPRLLNALRIYVIKGFKHRVYDLMLFEFLAGIVWSIWLGQKEITLAHVWDSTPSLIRRLKMAGVTVILDVPIAPNSYAKSVVDAHGERNLTYDAKVMELESQALRLADHVIAPSEFVADEVRKIAPETPVSVVPFGVDMPGLDEVERADRTVMRFAFAGAVNARKGIHDLLGVWQGPGFSQAELHLCGRVFPDIRQRISTITHSGRIVTPGYVNTFEYLSMCDVFVFPSWMEGSAKAVYEAMSVGLPVIASRQAGSIVRNGVDGFIIEAGDTVALREKMKWFLGNPEAARDMGRSAREHVSHYPWERYAREVTAIYRSVGADPGQENPFPF